MTEPAVASWEKYISNITPIFSVSREIKKKTTIEVKILTFQANIKMLDLFVFVEGQGK